MWNYFFIYFVVLSFVGWVYETIVMTIWDYKWTNRGFLFGPIIPIYGFGAFLCLVIFTLLFPNPKWYAVALAGYIGSIVLEWTTSVVLEKAFHAKWWDYSSAPFNIQGRICLGASLGFALAAMIVVFFINPFVWPIILKIPYDLAAFVSWLLTFIVVMDFTSTLFVLKGFERAIVSMNDSVNTKIDTFVDKAIKKVNPKYITVIKKVLTYDYRNDPKVNKLLNEVKDKIKSLK